MVVTGITNVYHKVPHDEPEDEEKNSYMDQGNTSDRQHVLPVVVDSSDGGGKSSSSTWQKVGSAVFYGFSSVLIVFVNKILLTNFRFPSFLWVGIGQMAVTILILFVTRTLGYVKIPRMDRTTPRRIFPLPLFYAFNLMSGLGGTKKTNLPMFTVLRRFSILMTMMLEYLIIGVKPTFSVKVSVFLMIFGSFVAAFYDLSFDAHGYALIMINNVCTAANGVYVKQKLEARDLGKYGLLYYNSIFMLFPALFTTVFFSNDYQHIKTFIDDGGLTVSVLFCFLLSCVCGFVLNYSLILCSTHNSALTTTCVGPIKNLIVTYAGMVSSGDYVFQWLNFIGVNISVFGSVLYTYVTFRTSKSSPTNGSKPAARTRQITRWPSEIRRNDKANEDGSQDRKLLLS